MYGCLLLPGANGTKLVSIIRNSGVSAVNVEGFECIEVYRDMVRTLRIVAGVLVPLYGDPNMH